MSISLASPISGALVSGFTTPSFTVAVDTPPNAFSRQWYVSAVSGATGVEAHTVSKPFTVTFFRPQTLTRAPQPNALTGVIVPSGTNGYRVLTRKGTLVGANSSVRNINVETRIPVPAGAETYAIQDVKAALSLHIAALEQYLDGLVTTVQTGSL